MKKLKVLVFDVYGTLFDVDSISTTLESYFPGKGTSVSVIWRKKQLEYTWIYSLMNKYINFEELTLRAFRFSIRALNLEFKQTEEEIFSLYYKLPLFPDVVETLTKLKKNYTLAILSNGTSNMLSKLLKNSNIHRFFSKVISVEQAQIYKPSPRVYKLILNEFHMEKEFIGFISSNAWDIAGASLFGFHTFWVNRRKQPSEFLEFTPDVEIPNLKDLCSIL